MAIRKKRRYPKSSKIKPGDIYIDCAYHPVLCLEANEDNITGVSLVDGSMPRSCSQRHCGPEKISAEQAADFLALGPSLSCKQHVANLKANGWPDMDDWWNKPERKHLEKYIVK